MVRFVTTAYTHMYENSYIGRPEEKYRHKDPNELSPVGKRVERWRKKAGLEVKEVIKQANENLTGKSTIDSKLYWAFLRGNERLTDPQIRAVAKVFGIPVFVMTNRTPQEAAEEARRNPRPKTIKIPTKPKSPTKAKQTTSLKKTVKPQGAVVRSTGGAKEPAPYDADAAAELLAKKFKVSRSK